MKTNATTDVEPKLDSDIPAVPPNGCGTCHLFDQDVLTAAIHLQQLKRDHFSRGHVEIHFTAEGMINTNAIFDVSRRKRM